MGQALDYGVLKPLIGDGSINEIMVNGHEKIFVEQKGQILSTELKFKDQKALEQLIQSIAFVRGVEITPKVPFLDTYLDDGSRVHIVIPPMAVDGPILTIRKFMEHHHSLKDLVNIGTLTERCAYFLDLCIRDQANMIISGGTSSGKTTFLNALATQIPLTERIITIEDTPEIKLKHPNWARLESVPKYGAEGLTARDCLINALRMRPDRIIVGECRRDETFEMLQAMNTGHDGSLTTMHANSPRDCIARIESLVLSSMDFPMAALRRQIVSAVDIIIQLRHDRSGDRMVTDVMELSGIEQNTITTQSVFALDRNDNAEPTGLVPKIAEQMKKRGLNIPDGFFDPKVLFKLS